MSTGVHARFRSILEKHGLENHRPDRWECAVLDRVIIALRFGCTKSDLIEAEYWCSLASSLLDFYEQERTRDPRAMAWLAASQRPIKTFMDELDKLPAP